MKKSLITLVLVTTAISSFTGCVTQGMDKKLYEWAYRSEINQNQESKQQDKNYQQNEQVAYLNE